MAEMSMSEIVKMATEVAATAALEHLEKEERQRQKKKQDWRLRNTKLLLKNYRLFVEHAEEVKTFLAQDAETLEELYSEEFAVQSIMRSKQRTLVIVRFIQRVLESYRIMCERSGHDEERRRYEVIHAMYVSEEKLSVEDVAKCQKIDVRTVYRDINDASKTLSVLVFGVDAIRLE